MATIMPPLVALLLDRLPSAEAATAAVALWEGEQGGGHGGGVEALASFRGGVSARLGANYDQYDEDAVRSSLHVASRLVYLMAKVVGYKTVSTHLPNEVKHVERVFYSLLLWRRDPEKHREWEVRYCLLMWLGTLVLVPFSLEIIDSLASVGPQPLSTTSPSAAVAPSTHAGEKHHDGLSDKILAAATALLDDPSKCREAAALLIGRLLTRPDAQALRRRFLDHAAANVQSALASKLSPHVQWGGVLLAVATMLKLGKREEFVTTQTAAFAGALSPVALSSPDAYVCKTAVKAVQRLGLVFLPQALSQWRTAVAW